MKLHKKGIWHIKTYRPLLDVVYASFLKISKLVNESISRITKRDVFIVAECKGVVIEYNQKDYENVIENLGFATPIIIKKFISEEDALNFLRIKSQEMFDDPDYNNFHDDYYDDLMND